MSSLDNEIEKVIDRTIRINPTRETNKRVVTKSTKTTNIQLTDKNNLKTENNVQIIDKKPVIRIDGGSYTLIITLVLF